ncbi:MAG TPA: hypothetical protein VGG28_34715 [Kofleriaceae bacterium]
MDTVITSVSHRNCSNAPPGPTPAQALQSRKTTEDCCMSNFVETWKGIATALGRSERWCRYMARRGADPLPVFKVGGIVRLNAPDLEDWLARQRDRSIRVPVITAPVVAAPVATDETALRLIA